jgi:hypothetical protein
MLIDLIERIATIVPAGSIILHESDGSVYRAVGWKGGRAGGPAAFLYTVDSPEGSFTQDITVQDLLMAYEELVWTGVLTRRRLGERFAAVDAQERNFTVIGALFQLLGEAVWGGPCVYWRVAQPVWIGY